MDIQETAARADSRYGMLDDLLASGAETLRTPADWERRRGEIRANVLHFLGDFPRDRPELKPRVVREVPCDGYTRKKVRYLTEPART